MQTSLVLILIVSIFQARSASRLQKSANGPKTSKTSIIDYNKNVYEAITKKAQEMKATCFVKQINTLRKASVSVFEDDGIGLTIFVPANPTCHQTLNQLPRKERSKNFLKRFSVPGVHNLSSSLGSKTKILNTKHPQYKIRIDKARYESTGDHHSPVVLTANCKHIIRTHSVEHDNIVIILHELDDYGVGNFVLKDDTLNINLRRFGTMEKERSRIICRGSIAGRKSCLINQASNQQQLTVFAPIGTDWRIPNNDSCSQLFLVESHILPEAVCQAGLPPGVTTFANDGIELHKRRSDGSFYFTRNNDRTRYLIKKELLATDGIIYGYDVDRNQAITSRQVLTVKEDPLDNYGLLSNSLGAGQLRNIQDHLQMILPTRTAISKNAAMDFFWLCIRNKSRIFGDDCIGNNTRHRTLSWTKRITIYKYHKDIYQQKGLQTTINCQVIRHENVLTCEGTAQIVDEAPKFVKMTILEYLEKQPEFSIFTKAVKDAGTYFRLNSTADWHRTVFVFNNRLARYIWDNTSIAADVKHNLHYYVITEYLCSAGIVADYDDLLTQEVRTIGGSTGKVWRVHSQDDSSSDQNNDVITYSYKNIGIRRHRAPFRLRQNNKDIVTENGIIHEIYSPYLS